MEKDSYKIKIHYKNINLPEEDFSKLESLAIKTPSGDYSIEVKGEKTIKRGKIVTIGRSPESDIILKGMTISRKQGEFKLREYEGDLDGIIYTNEGSNTNIMPNLTGENMNHRRMGIVKGEAVRIYPGESLTFSNKYTLTVEK